jgi:hypothetical protein
MLSDLALFLILVGFLCILRSSFGEIKTPKSQLEFMRKYSKENPDQAHLKEWLDKQ